MLEEQISEWEKWNYKDGMILPKRLTYPYRQKRAGMPYGVIRFKGTFCY